jgi:uncharacterized protein (DUF1499 family)
MPKTPDVGLLEDGQLHDCAEPPNCVCSCASDESQRVKPFPITGSIEDTYQRLIAIVSKLRGATIVEQQENRYLRVEFRSLIFRFVDDFELSISESEGVTHVRSASRVGYGDLGVNARRVERIRRLLADSD